MSTFFYISYAAIWLLLIIVTTLLLLLYRHIGLAALGTLEGVQRDGLSIGALAPTISGITAIGEDVVWEPRRGLPHLLLFASPDCEPCADVLPDVNRLAAVADGALGILAIVPGPQEDVARLVELYRPSYQCLAEDASGASGRYRVRVTPFAFIVGPDGRVLAKGVCNDAAHLQSLLEIAGLDEVAALAAPPNQPIPVGQRDLVEVHGSAGTNGRFGGNVVEWSGR